MSNKVELLAPAGNFDALIAAVQNGANAVYLGGDRFGARAFAGNFNDEQLKQAVAYAHIRNVKIYVTVNTIIDDLEFDQCIDFVQFLYNINVDALIIQDMGLAYIARKLFPDFEIHASTQMSISNTQDALFYKSMGFKRIVLARENSYEEINVIKQNTGLEIESFVHGALCVSYSGKCLFSFAKGGRSSNKGACAQPCRQKYSFKQNGNAVDSIYFLSTKDLSSIKELDKIIQNGTDSLKIEGRMKRPEYVATVVKSYREALNGIEKGIPVDYDQLEMNMKSIFNREFTKGFILKEYPNRIVNSATPNNIGIRIGTVLRIDSKNKKIDILLEGDLSKGDGLSLGEHVGRIIKNGKIVDHATANDQVTLDFIGQAKVGEEVRKTSDSKVLNTALETMATEHIKTSVYGVIKVKINEFPSLELWDDRGNVVAFTDNEEKVQPSVKNPLSEEIILKQLNKTESLPYNLKDLEIRLDEGAFLRVSTLNKLRREAFEQLSKSREILSSRIPINVKLDSFSSNITKQSKLTHLSANMIRVKCYTQEQLQACMEVGVDSVYVDTIENYLLSIGLGLETYFYVPIMIKDRQIRDLDGFITRYQPNILTNSIGFASYINNKYQELGSESKIRLDYLANILNRYSLEMLEELDFLDSASLSIESSKYTDDTTFGNTESLLEIPIYLHPTLMFTEFCPNKKIKRCSTCNIHDHKLISEKNQSTVTLKRGMFCRMQIIDNAVIDKVASKKSFLNRGIDKFRVDLLNESKNETKRLLMSLIGN